MYRISRYIYFRLSPPDLQVFVLKKGGGFMAALNSIDPNISWEEIINHVDEIPPSVLGLVMNNRFSETFNIPETVETAETNIYRNNNNVLKLYYRKFIAFPDWRSTLIEATTMLSFLHGRDYWPKIFIGKKFNDHFEQFGFIYPALYQHLDRFLHQEDIYISVNSFRGSKRVVNELARLNANFAELDYGDVIKYKHMTPVAMLDLLNKTIFSKGILPHPNMVLFSGNKSLQLYWVVEPIYLPKKTEVRDTKVYKLWEWVQRYINKALKEYGSCRHDAARYLRIAGSVSSKSKGSAYIIYHHPQKFTLRQMQMFLPAYVPKGSRWYEQVKPNQRSCNYKDNKIKQLTKNWYSLMLARLDDYVKLQELRNHAYEIGATGSEGYKGYRELLCFLFRYTIACVERGPEARTEAYRRMLEFNIHFSVPLDPKSLKQATQSAERYYCEFMRNFDPESGTMVFKKYGFNPKNYWLIEELDITEEEMEHLKTIIDTKQKAKRDRKRKKLLRRNDEGLTNREQKKMELIKQISAYRNDGLNQSKIAAKLGVSKTIVSRYLRKAI